MLLSEDCKDSPDMSRCSAYFQSLVFKVWICEGFEVVYAAAGKPEAEQQSLKDIRDAEF